MIRKLLCVGVLGGLTIPSSQAQMMCAGDLHVGYYLENPLNNPEDPVPGTLFLNIPSDDSTFAGEMYFTYQGCQSENIGSVAGNRLTNNLSGSWAGTVDNTAQSGSFVGTLAAAGTFNGTYDVDGGKQQIIVEDCVEYFIAANGTWLLQSVAQPSPDDSLISYSDGQVAWDLVDNALFTHCQLIDLSRASCSEPNAVLWQAIALASDGALNVPLNSVSDGREYAVSCGQFDNQASPLAFSKSAFTQVGNPNPAPLFADGFEDTGPGAL
ncbi:MAG: hypothetical protein AB8B96_16455 [Lysobacterales bacterium]